MHILCFYECERFYVMMKPGRIAICLIDPYVQRCHVLVLFVLCICVLSVVMMDRGELLCYSRVMTTLLVNQ